MAVPVSFHLGSEYRTIYRDILNLPDPTQLGFTTRIFNDDTVGLYFRMTGSGGAAWTFTTVDVGLIAAGTNVYRNFDNFASRTKPTSELTETIYLILRAYTDAGYTNLKWEYRRTVTVVWIKSDDPSYTVDFLNNFDDGTVQGWAVADEVGNAGGYPTIAAVTDYYLSAPYSVKMVSQRANVGELRSRLYKSFTTPDKPVVYAIIDVRLSAMAAPSYMILKYLQLQRDTTVLVFIGRPYDTTTTEYIPRSKWLRVVVPLPKNTTLEVRLVLDGFSNTTTTEHYLWMDDFKIISK